MAENGILKIGKTSSFQAHQIEQQLGAYTDCNHGQGLAVIHPVLYRRLCKDSPTKFARFAVNVLDVCSDGKSETEIALEGIERLADFIKEMGLPITFTEMCIDKDIDLHSVAYSTNIITNGCFRPLTHDEIFMSAFDLNGAIRLFVYFLLMKHRNTAKIHADKFSGYFTNSDNYQENFEGGFISCFYS